MRFICAHCGRSDWFEAQTAQEEREQAEAAGWSVTDHNTFCPKHA